MKTREEKKQITRDKRAMRIRKHLRGTIQKPRLSVFRSDLHIYAQLIDDESGVTLASASTNANVLKSEVKSLSNIDAAALVGERLGAMALEKNIKQVVFDRGPYKYHGRVAALADGARKAGLNF